MSFQEWEEKNGYWVPKRKSRIVECQRGDSFTPSGFPAAINLADISYLCEVNLKYVRWPDAKCWVQMGTTGFYVDMPCDELLKRWREWERGE